MEELKRLALLRDKAEAELLHILRIDGNIADAMRDYWKCQASGAE